VTLGQALAAAERRLADAGCDSPRLDARLLAAFALRMSPDAVRAAADRALAPDDATRLAALVARRAGAREPVSRIVGLREFWSLPFALSPATLDPRPDSETLVATALRCFPDPARPLAVLDLGTGTGCLLLAVLHERPAATGLGIDAAPEAVATAADNARRLGLAERARFAVGDWGAGIDGGFDVVLTNPPYLSAADMAALAPEVARHDPRRALDGGQDGLDAYRRLMPDLARLLAPGGGAFVETGAAQAVSVALLAEASGLIAIEIVHDLAGRDRCVVLRRHDPAAARFA
jgi:release factor glutamine methyltransferase